MENKVGIDYGMGLHNVDKKNGIHFGVISQHSVMPEAMDDFEPDYGKASCPSCGNEIREATGEEDSDYFCDKCKESFESHEVWDNVEPNGFTYEQEEYTLTECLETNIFVLKSPYFTYAVFCSPCVPGAGDLDSANPDGVKTYALGHDWFESGEAPYPLFNIEDGKEVIAKEEN